MLDTHTKKNKNKKKTNGLLKRPANISNVFLKVLPPESLAPSSSWFARVTAQDQVASGLHRLLSTDSKNNNKK